MSSNEFYDVFKEFFMRFDEINRRLRRIETWEPTSLVVKYSTVNVSTPPTDAQLTNEFGDPTTLNEQWLAILDDNGAGAAVYLITHDGTDFWYTSLTKAV